MADISVIKLPNGSEYNIVDNTSGYATLASPNFTGTPTAPTPTASDNSTKIATTAYVDAAITNLPEPMLFKGSLGIGGTITSLPSATTFNEGFVYKVITNGTYASQAAKVGDIFISDGSNWVLIPSGDEPSGTVTSVGLTNATNGGLSISGSPVTSSGSITVGHSNVLSAAQTTQAVYPIKIDKNGHISEYGSAVSIPTKVSDLTNDSGFITSYTETDPVFTASAAAGISSTDITNWNNKADEYTAGDGIDITSNVISVDSNLTVQGDTAYIQYTEPIDVTKQDVLVSGQNIKTINNQSILGSGNINTVTNLVDGSSVGSIRGIGTVEQGTGYALGNYALAAGQGTASQGRSQTTIGEYNTIDSSSNSSTRGQYAFVIGNGIDTNTRSNAFTVDWQGNTQVKKTLTVGSNSNITGGLQVGALENDYGLNDQALLEEETKQKWNTILGNGALANLLAGDVGGRIATSGGGSTISNMNWNLVDTVIGNSDSITIPEDVFTYNEQVEVLAQVVLTQGTTDVTICGSFLIPNNNDIWMMNGYVTSSTDWGLVDFNLSDHGRTIELNNCYYAATQHNTDATVNIYYRLEESLLTDDVINVWTEILGGDPSLNPSAGNIAATGSAWLQVQDPQNLPTNVTLGSNNLMYKTSSDRNTVILTGTLSVNLAAVSITDTAIDIPLGFNVSRVPSTAVELPLGVDGDQSYAIANIKVGTTGAVSLIIQVIDNGGIATELSLGFSGSFFPLV